MNIASSLPPSCPVFFFFVLSDVALHSSTTVNDRLSALALVSFSLLMVQRLSESSAYFNCGSQRGI